MLTNDETAELLKKAQSGDDYAKEQLITLNSPLIKSIVKRYIGKGLDYEDLFQLGAMGFVKAINNYNPEFNVKFTTYAVPMIAGEIKRFLRDDGSVKVSRSIKHNANLIKNYVNEFIKTHSTSPDVETISKALNIDKNDIILAMEANTNPLSLNENYTNSEDESVSIIDKLSDGFSIDNFIDKLTLRELIEGLSSREKQVIILRYYLDKTQSEIAKELGISQVQISRIENKVLNELKNNLIVWVIYLLYF